MLSPSESLPRPSCAATWVNLWLRRLSMSALDAAAATTACETAADSARTYSTILTFPKGAGFNPAAIVGHCASVISRPPSTYSHVYSCRVSRPAKKETGVGSTDDIRFKTIELLPRHNTGGRETIPDPTLNGVHEVRSPAETSALALAPAAKAETSTTHLSPSSWISSTVYSRPDCCSMSLRALARLSR